MEQVDVVVVGAGPVGLALAGELTLAGVRPVVLEQRTEPNPVPKANGMVGQVVRWLDHRGLYQRLTGTEAAPAPIPQYMFGGLPLPIGTAPDNPLFAVAVPQWDLERGLGEWVAQSGVDVRRGVGVTGVAQDDEGVTVWHTNGSIRARYVVGCDGGHSEVRKQAGIDFVGVTTDRITSHTAHVVFEPGVLDRGGLRVAGVGPLPPFAYHRTEHGMFVFAQFQPGATLVTTMEWDRPAQPEDAPVTIDDVRAAVRRVLGVDLPMSLPDTPGRWVLRRVQGRNTRQATTYRAGRVFVAGDAAHVHAAVGGPGLNLGILDVVNLAWKLAGTVQGWAPESLLDTYHGERYPVGQRVVLQTQAQAALLAPGTEVTALRSLLGELLAVPDNARRIADLMSGGDTRYPCLGDVAHRWAGRFVPDFPLTVAGRATRLAEVARTGRALLLDLTGDPALAQVAAGWSGRVDHVVASTDDPPAPAVLIRPDGHAAWIAARIAPPDGTYGSLADALGTWFGAPVAAATS